LREEVIFSRIITQRLPLAAYQVALFELTTVIKSRPFFKSHSFFSSVIVFHQKPKIPTPPQQMTTEIITYVDKIPLNWKLNKTCQHFHAPLTPMGLGSRCEFGTRFRFGYVGYETS